MATATEPSTPLVPVVTSCASNGSSQASVGAEGSAVLTEASLSHRYNDGRSEGVGLVGPVETPFATVTLEQFDELTVPRLYIQTRKGTIDEESIGQVLGCLDDVLARGHPLTITYDLRTAPLPSRKQIGIGLDWIAANGPKLDVQLQGVAIVLSSAIVRGVVNFVLHLTQPPQPNGCFGDEPSAFAFARDKCTEVRVWVPARKLKRQQSMDATTEAAVDGTPPKQSPRRWMSGFSAGFTPSSRASSAEVEAEESPERPDLKRASTAW